MLELSRGPVEASVEPLVSEEADVCELDALDALDAESLVDTESAVSVLGLELSCGPVEASVEALVSNEADLCELDAPEALVVLDADEKSTADDEESESDIGTDDEMSE